MKDSIRKSALHATDVPVRTKPSVYPEPFASRMKGRTKRQLGDYFGLQKFGVNRTELQPGGQSALLHKHSRQEEFIFVLSGHPTLVLENEEIELAPGMCAGFGPHGSAHYLINRSTELAVYLEVGDREKNDVATYPQDDLIAEMGEDGQWKFCHKDGTPY